jgi:hypothetical protein
MNKPPLQGSSFVARLESLLTAPSEGGITMIADSQDEIYRLDAVGERIWSLLEQPCAVSAVCKALEDEFSVDPETCERDVLAFLEQLREKGLIRLVPEPPSG